MKDSVKSELVAPRSTERVSLSSAFGRAVYAIRHGFKRAAWKRPMSKAHITNFLACLDHNDSRRTRLQQLRDFYLTFLCEDPIEGTSLDCDVLDAIKKLEVAYGDS